MLLPAARVSLLVLLASVAAAQPGTPRPAGTYAFTVAVPVIGCSFDGVGDRSPETQAPQGAAFFYVQPSKDGDKDGDMVVIQFLRWRDTDASTNARLYATVVGSGPDTTTIRKNFCVRRTAFERLAVRVFDTGVSSWEFNAGALLLPVKLRAGPFDFSKDVTLGTAAGTRWRLSARKEVFFSVLGGVGLSSVTLGDVNTKGVIKESTDRAAVTWLGGAMLEIDKFQFGAFLGQDRISAPNQDNWVYQGKTWLAVGLGYSLFGSPASKDATDKK